ncbi:MAG: ABC transporter ATP-binding protein [Nitrospinae bacterium]|nr:ABC transporter ATP-binding protein [Nitrospinota bacterium]
MSNLLSVENLRVRFDTPHGPAWAVDDVSFSMSAGETLGIVGESGCGKTITALSILRLAPSSATIAGGRVMFEGRDLLALSNEEIRDVRGRKIAMIFQEPMTALNPVFTIGNQIAEGILAHFPITKKEAWDKAVEMLAKVGIPSPERRVGEYPHQLSGGMRQRAMIAMALAMDPSLLIADEPTTALDVTIQAQILELLLDLKNQFGMSMILITHDLGVVAQTCDDVVVMYAGKVAESAPVKSIFANPKHPYTQGLLDSVASRKSAPGDKLREIKGTVPSLMEMPTGCPFHPRCPKAMSVCREKMPELKEVGAGQKTACWLY